MQSKKRLFRFLGIAVFSAGILVGMVLFILMNWAYFEAHFFFGYFPPAEKTLTTLRCPLLMTSSESGAVTIRITNNTDRDLTPMIWIEISSNDSVRWERSTYPIAAGETRILSWKLTSSDISYKHLIMVRVYMFEVFKLPSRDNTCGTLVVNLQGLSGIQLFLIGLGLSLGCIATGWILWLAGSRPFQADGVIATRAMFIFTAVVLLGILSGCVGWWGVGLFSCVVCVLLIITVIGYNILKK